VLNYVKYIRLKGMDMEVKREIMGKRKWGNK
jgi:hypothetical protein